MWRLPQLPVSLDGRALLHGDEAFDETQVARHTAERFGAIHTEFRVKPSAVDLIDTLIYHHDGPFGDSSAIPTYLVSQLTRQHVTVVLTGDGGDELFAGYDKYVVEGRERRYDSIPRPLRKVAGAFGSALPEGTPGRRFLRHQSSTLRGSQCCSLGFRCERGRMAGCSAVCY